MELPPPLAEGLPGGVDVVEAFGQVRALLDAREKFFEAISRLSALYGASGSNQLVVAIDTPQVNDLPLSYYDSFLAATTLNPDYLGQLKKIASEKLRVAYAKNQRLPQLDLKASYGLNGLGRNHAIQTLLRHLATLGPSKKSKSIFKGNLPLCLRGYGSANNARFALYRRQALTQSLPCIVLFLVHETTNVGRVIAQDQNGTTLMEVAGTLYYIESCFS